MGQDGGLAPGRPGAADDGDLGNALSSSKTSQARWRRAFFLPVATARAPTAESPRRRAPARAGPALERPVQPAGAGTTHALGETGRREPLDERRDARQGPQVRLEPVRPRPIRNAVSTRASCGWSSRGRRPSRPAAVRPSRPCCFHVWYRWCAVWRLTPYRATTTACDAPRANRRAAANRRASSAAISSFLAMSHHGIVAHEAGHVIHGTVRRAHTGRRAAGSARRRCTPRIGCRISDATWWGAHGRSTPDSGTVSSRKLKRASREPLTAIRHLTPGCGRGKAPA